MSLALLPPGPAEAQTTVSVSNITYPNSSANTISGQNQTATAFTTGGVSTDRYTLNSVVISVGSGSGQFEVSIHNPDTGDSNNPGTRIGTALTGNITGAGNVTYTAGSGNVITLNGSATYFVRVTKSGTTNRALNMTIRDTQIGTDGWLIADVGRNSGNGGTSWSNSGSRVIKFTVNATTVSTPRLTASNRTKTGATLTIANHSAAWWYKRTAPTAGTCTSRTAAQTTATLTGLTQGTSYTYKAYSAAGCGNADEIATAMFQTLAPELTASNITGTTATLTLANHSAAWWYKRTAPTAGTCTSRTSSQTTAELTGLTQGTSYTYKAYSAAGCGNADAIATAMFDSSHPRSPRNVRVTKHFDAAEPDGYKHWMILHWDFIPGPRSQTRYAFRYKTGSGGWSKWYAAHNGLFNNCDWPCHYVWNASNPSTAYTFQLRASRWNPAGTIKIWDGPPSAEVTATNLNASGMGAEETAAVSLSAAPDRVEEGTPVTVTATLSRALPASVTIPLAVTDITSESADWGAPPSIVIAPGDTTGTSSMTTGIDLDGDDETFRVGLDTANLPSTLTAGSPATHTVTVTDTTTGSAEPLPVQFPKPPATVRAEPGSGEIVLTWSDVSGLGIGWEVQQVQEGSEVWTATGGTARTHTVTGLTNGNAYTFKVRATSFYGAIKGNASAGVTETAGAPAKPDAVAAVNVAHKGTSLAVSWEAPARATHYDVAHSTDGGQTWTEAASAQRGTGLTVTGADRTKAYTVRVRARNAGGQAAWTSSAQVSYAAPAAVASVSVTHNGSSLGVTWDASAGAESYGVDVSGAGGGSWSTATPKQTGTSLTIGGVYAGTTYTVRVRAKNAAGESGWTNSAPATAPAPDAVARVNVVHNSDRLAVSWEAPARATHYDVTYSGGGVTGRAAWNRAGESLEITCDVRDEYAGRHCIRSGATYTVSVRARNAAGESGWAKSAPASLAAPAAVDTVNVTHQGSKLAVSWEAPAGATHYDVTYSGGGVTGRAAWNRAGTALEITCDVRPAHEGEHCVTSGTAWTVGVRARNAVGESAWTNSAPASVEEAPPTVGPPAPTEAPDAVASVRVVHQGSQLAVSWEAPARATHYDVTYSGGGVTGRAAWNRAGERLEITCDSRPTHEGQNCIARGATYTVGVRARNAAGESGWTNSAPAAPPAALLSVADATVAEPSGTATATLDFVVTLDRASSGTVTAVYTTADGTAVAGSDYTATLGTLTFAAGETSKTVSVSVLPDAHDDGGETMKLLLLSASGATISDGEATGTITNDGPLQRAWLARFGRTVGTHVLDAIGDRLRSPPGQASSLTIGGAQVPLGRGAPGPTNGSTSPGPSLQKRGNNAAPAGTLRLRSGQAQAGPDHDTTVGADLRVRPAPSPQPSPSGGEGERGGTASALLDSLARVLGLGGNAGTPGDAGPGAFTDPRLNQGQTPQLDLRQVLQGSSFRLNLNGADPGTSPRLTAWGRFAGTTFQGTEGDLALDGDVLTGTVGLDATLGRWLGGLAVAHSRGNGTYTMPLADGQSDAGDLEQTLTSVQPYLRYAVTDRLDVWGLLGYGWGAMEIDMARGGTIETDTRLLLGALGGRGLLLAPEDTGGFQLATRTDAMMTRTSADAAVNSAATDADAHRVRLLLEGSRGVAWADGRTLTPTVELGVRHDGGDAETGFGLEVGGRVQYADPTLGLTVDATVRGLLAHEDDDYDEWGASGTVRLAPGANGQGLSLTLAPAWGATTSGVQGLWTRQTTQGLAPPGQQQTPGGRLAAEVGYGVTAFTTGLVTPYAGTMLADGAARTYRVGARLQLPGATTNGLTLSLEGTRQEPGGLQPVNQGLRLDLTWGF